MKIVHDRGSRQNKKIIAIQDENNENVIWRNSSWTEVTLDEPRVYLRQIRRSTEAGSVSERFCEGFLPNCYNNLRRHL